VNLHRWLRGVARRWSAVAVGGIVVAFLGQAAVADPNDALNLALSDTLSYDGNVFRVPDSAGPQSDRINATTVGLKFDKPYAQQRFQFDINRTRTLYNTLSYLDSTALNYRGAWLWAVTPHLTGTLSADRSQAQIPFAQIGGTQLNLRTTTDRNLNIDAWVSGGWHLLAGFGHTESTTQQTVLSQPSYLNHQIQAGFRYDALSGNSVTFTQQSTPAEVVNQLLVPVNLIDTNYADTESDLSARWQPSGNSTVTARLSHKERRNVHFAQRDFSGMAGELRYLWTPTGKLQFNLAASQDVLPYAAYGNIIQNSTYQLSHTLALGSVWQLDTKLAAHLNITRTLSDYLGPVFAITGPARHDDYRTLQLGVDWTLRRYLSLNATLERDQRSTNIEGFEFNDNLATIGATLTF